MIVVVVAAVAVVVAAAVGSENGNAIESDGGNLPMAFLSRVASRNWHSPRPKLLFHVWVINNPRPKVVREEERKNQNEKERK